MMDTLRGVISIVSYGGRKEFAIPRRAKGGGDWK